MNSQRGITLTSLVIYITVVLIVLGILAVITGSLQGNIKDIYAEGTNNAEIDKFNVYFLKEVKKQGNAINTISDNEVLFKTGNKYTFNNTDKCIFLNNDIKIAENIEKCEFSKSQENENVIRVKIKAIIGEEKIIDYVLNKENYNISYEDELNYINNKILPSEYQQVEYVTFKNDNNNRYDNCINTLIKFNEADKIEFIYKSNDAQNYMMFFAAYNSDTHEFSSPYLSVNQYRIL